MRAVAVTASGAGSWTGEYAVFCSVAENWNSGDGCHEPLSAYVRETVRPKIDGTPKTGKPFGESGVGVRPVVTFGETTTSLRLVASRVPTDDVSVEKTRGASAL